VGAPKTATQEKIAIRTTANAAGILMVGICIHDGAALESDQASGGAIRPAPSTPGGPQGGKAHLSRAREERNYPRNRVQVYPPHDRDRKERHIT